MKLRTYLRKIFSAECQADVFWREVVPQKKTEGALAELCGATIIEVVTTKWHSVIVNLPLFLRIIQTFHVLLKLFLEQRKLHNS